MFSFKEFISEGGLASERQERDFIDIINKYSKNSPITVNGIPGVIGAEKMAGRNQFNTEQYTDVVLNLSNGKKINLSLKKGTEDGIAKAPSVAGGGMAGLVSLVPDIVSRFLNKANEWYKHQGYKKGSLIPDIYGRLESNLTYKIIRGTAQMGGPIDYMYIGPMEVSVASFAKSNLALNGKMISVREYAKSHPIYFRLRKRRNDQPYEPDLSDAEGNPLILGKSPSKGDKGRRIVMVPSIPKDANLIEF